MERSAAPGQEVLVEHRFLGGLNKFIVFAFYCLYAWVLGPSMVNFTPIKDMLIRTGAYEWLCYDDPEDFDHRSNDHMALCIDQDVALSGLLTAFTSGKLVCAFLAGLSADLIGSKLTSMTGIFLQWLGWILLGLSNEQFRAYVPAMLSFGIGVNFSFFALLDSVVLFPKSGSFCISVLAMCRSFSFVQPFMLNRIVTACGIESFSTVIPVYATITHIYTLVVCILFIPWRKYVAPHWVKVDRSTIATPTDIQGKSTDIEVVPVTDIETNKKGSKGTTQKEAGSLDQLATGTGGDIAPVYSPKIQGGIVQSVMSAQFVLCFAYFGLYMMRQVFLIPSADVLVPDIYTAHQILTAVAAAPCPIYGKIGDRWTPLAIMHLHNSFALLSIVFAIAGGVPGPVFCQVLSSLCLTFSLSLMFSQIFCYITYYFSRELKGTLSGIVQCGGGIMSLAGPPLKAAALNGSLFTIMGLFICTSLINEAILVCIQLLNNKRKRQWMAAQPSLGSVSKA